MRLRPKTEIASNCGASKKLFLGITAITLLTWSCTSSHSDRGYAGLTLGMPSKEARQVLHKKNAMKTLEVYERDVPEGKLFGAFLQEGHVRVHCEFGDQVTQICGSLNVKTTPVQSLESNLRELFGKPSGNIINGNTRFYWWGNAEFQKDKLESDYVAIGDVAVVKCVSDSCKFLIRRHKIRPKGDFVLFRSFARLEQYSASDKSTKNGTMVHVSLLAGEGDLCFQE